MNGRFKEQTADLRNERPVWGTENAGDVAREARRIYEEQLHASLEESHMNEFVAIEPTSDEYFLGRTLSEAIGASRTNIRTGLPMLCVLVTEPLFTSDCRFDRIHRRKWTCIVCVSFSAFLLRKCRKRTLRNSSANPYT